MTTEMNDLTYGVTEVLEARDQLDEVILELKYWGFSSLPSGVSDAQLDVIGGELETIERIQRDRLGESLLRDLDDFNIVRSPLSEMSSFLQIALNKKLRELATRYLRSEVILMQQNGLINRENNQNPTIRFHRDLHHQHWVSSRPMALNALLAVDDFTLDNGATWVIPSSHRVEEFPSRHFCEKFKKQVLVPRGHFMVLDAMLYHAAGVNYTGKKRRAINHVIGRPFFSQQIDIRKSMEFHNQSIEELSDKDKEFLGFFWRPGQDSDSWRREKLRRKTG